MWWWWEKGGREAGFLINGSTLLLARKLCDMADYYARARASAFAFRNDECKVIWIWLLFDITPPIKQNHYYTSQ